MQKRSVTVRMARWSATHPWKAIIGWVVFVAVCVVGSGIAGTVDATSADYRIGEAGRAEALLAEGGMTDPVVEKVLITSPSGGLPPEADAAAREVSERMRALPAVAEVGEPVHAPSGNALLVQVRMHGDDKQALPEVGALLEQTASVQEAHPDLKVEQTGQVSIDQGIDEQLGEDLALGEKITLPVTVIILLMVFGSLLGAGVPVLLALSCVVTAMSLSALTSHLIPDVGTVKNIILLLGMAVGVDYSLFYIKREREERARSGGTLSHFAAIEVAAATSGHTVVVSGIAVMVSMASLYLAGDVVFASLATGSIAVVLVAVISSLTVLPAVLAKLGRRIDRPRVPFFGKLAERQGPGRFWPVMLRPSMKRPGATLAVSALAMLLLAAPALNMQLGLPGNNTLPKGIPGIQVNDRLVQEFPAEGASNFVAVRSDSAHAAEAEQALGRLVERAQQDPAITREDDAQVRTSADGLVHTVQLGIPYATDSPEASASLHRLRELAPAELGGVPSTEFAVGGGVARNVDTAGHQSETLPEVVAFVLLLTFVMMLISFRSAVLAGMSILLNLLSAGATFGVLVLVFQSSWAEGLLGFESGGFIVSRVPLFLFVILFGLSMDYHVFVVSRIKEAVQRGLPTSKAVHEGITSSAGVVTSAAIVMVSVFLSFVFTGLPEMKQLGLGLAVAVLLDAFVIRVLVLPSLMVLLGERTWWPARIRSPRGGRDRDREAVSAATR
ncbi:MMPL family transporter [Saccharopolyspora sp. NFXS83]|uniref:MMPL family transporter n=1 Tax=Saccharopolyspora sp. NFXS83 TaxID=2993560 RepID=UPI00224AF96A|nr:MMPL family transporter [Saccharopolyspora sp. NFXS83]MCX2732068.1 MMPL family transporter [Saccharopolyspora sp. NFXS83]